MKIRDWLQAGLFATAVIVVTISGVTLAEHAISTAHAQAGKLVLARDSTSTISTWQTVGNITQGNGTAVSLSTGTGANVCNITLTPGTWLVGGTCSMNGTGTLSLLQCGLNIVSATLPSVTATASLPLTLSLGGGNTSTCIPNQIITVAANTTVYVVAKSTFALGTCAASANCYGIFLQP